MPLFPVATTSVSILRIDGTTEGSILYSGAVEVSPNGHVTGDIQAAEIFVEGSVHGNIRATVSLRVASSAKIFGDLQSPRVAVERGAQLRGNIATRNVSPSSDLDDSAVDTLLSGAGAA
jgi:cytoskeletal protein CcmA (bactofilin family)